MDLGDLEYLHECYKCGCAYFEPDTENKILITQYLCKRCKSEVKTK